jgi:hypothetical protein
MNTFQQISRELVIEDLQRNKTLHFTAVSDPVTRQLIWRQICREQADVDGLPQKPVADETEGEHLLSGWKRKCGCFLQEILWRRPEK